MTYRLYTRTQDFESLGQCFISFDLTEFDFRSNPPLSYYVKYWFIDIDDLIDCLASKFNQRITLIISDLVMHITYDILRPIFPQIIQVIIIGKPSHRYENVKYFPDAQLLVDHLSSVVRDRQRVYITFDSWPVERTSYDLNKHTAKYLWYGYFYFILSRLKNTNVAREEMLASIQAFHIKQTDIVKRTCMEFQQSYNSNDIIKWYTRESFFYLLLNRTLRSEDINHIFAMRYVIFDLENYLRQHRHENHSLKTVYRGQQLHLEEIQEIEANIGGLIGLTAFWSTTHSEKTAFNFAEIWPRHRTDSVERVMFSINIPYGIQGLYSDISQFSRIEYELEVLFSFRSIFRVERVKRTGTDRFWYIDLTVIDENDEQFVSIMHPWYSSTKDIIRHRSFFTLQNVQINENFFRNLTLENGSFLAFQLLVDMMLRLDQNEFARNELLQVCRDSYADDPIELKKIDKFEQTYDPRDAIKWYTTDCFLYRLINRSLRTESIDHIFKLRYFIHDLHNQLAQIQKEFLRLLPSNQIILQLYRGLRMQLHELHDLERNEGNLVSTDTFLSTTSDYEAALSFSGDGNVEDNYVSVIYEITVDTRLTHWIPFAKIDYHSIFKDEDEVLFSMGAVFRVGQAKQLKDRLWMIELTLTSTKDEYWNVLTNHLHST
ncbi:unnamed protein product [Adineta steineri]|uniref:NAD(P)(+)--arginine ADP-ribosyltransferase n=6 Tax=Adineta steineri TaxID=433720 RepID=A0A815HPH1_9BILA|nr:unnamed protein product [Adineta steineri]CAF3683726.1 unnamed protein product [Adineta steineri]